MACAEKEPMIPLGEPATGERKLWKRGAEEEDERRRSCVRHFTSSSWGREKKEGEGGGRGVEREGWRERGWSGTGGERGGVGQTGT